MRFSISHRPTICCPSQLINLTPVMVAMTCSFLNQFLRFEGAGMVYREANCGVCSVKVHAPQINFLWSWKQSFRRKTFTSTQSIARWVLNVAQITRGNGNVWIIAIAQQRVDDWQKAVSENPVFVCFYVLCPVACLISFAYLRGFHSTRKYKGRGELKIARQLMLSPCFVRLWRQSVAKVVNYRLE